MAQKCTNNRTETVPTQAQIEAAGPINHEEAKWWALRFYETSNIARCYLALTAAAEVGPQYAFNQPKTGTPTPDGSFVITAAAEEKQRCNHWPGQKRCGVCGMGMGTALWETICLAYQGDTKACATPCLHCDRIAAAITAAAEVGEQAIGSEAGVCATHILRDKELIERCAQVVEQYNIGNKVGIATIKAIAAAIRAMKD